MVVDAVLAIRKQDRPIDLHMVEVMDMQHKTDTDTQSVTTPTIVTTPTDLLLSGWYEG